MSNIWYICYTNKFDFDFNVFPISEWDPRLCTVYHHGFWVLVVTQTLHLRESRDRVDILTAAEAESFKESQVVVQSEIPCTDSTVNATNLPKPLTHLFNEKHSLLSQDKQDNDLNKIMQTLPAHFSELNCKHLQESTWGQSSSEQWFEQRQGRFTVMKC